MNIEDDEVCRHKGGVADCTSLCLMIYGERYVTERTCSICLDPDCSGTCNREA